MVTKEIQTNTGTVSVDEGGYQPTATYYILSTDEKPIKNVHNAARLYLMDWKSLSNAEKTAAVAKIWMFDKENLRWLPQ